MKLKTVIAACAVAMLSLTSLASTYTWKSSVSEGDWATAENWESSDGGTSYPQSGDTAIFAADTTAHVVTLSSVTTIADLDLSAEGVSVTFKGADNVSTNDARLVVSSGSSTKINGKGLTLKLDHAALSLTPKNTDSSVASNSLGENGTLELVNGSDMYVTYNLFNTEKGGRVRLSDDSVLSCNRYCWGNEDNQTVIDDSQIIGRKTVRFYNTSGKIRFVGTHPLLYASPNFVGKSNDASGTLEFVVPSGGYANAPVQCAAGNTSRFGWEYASAKLYVSVASDSPAKQNVETLTTTLIYWPKNGILKTVATEGSLPQTTDAFAWSSETNPLTLGVSLSGSLVTVTEVVESGVWKELDLTLPTSTSDRDLYAVWGATDGGTTPANWTHQESTSFATVKAGETAAKFSLVGLSDAWGSDNNKVLRFYYLEDGARVWSEAVNWRDLSEVAFEEGISLDGTGGDVIKVGATLKNFAGGDCALKVLVGTAEDVLDHTFDVGTVAQGGAFEVAVTNQVLTPGAKYYVCVEATVGAKTARSDVGTVEMSGAATWKAAPTASAAMRKAVTITGQFSNVGMGGATTVTLWYKEDGTEEWTQATGAENKPVSLTVTDTSAFTISFEFPSVAKTYAWQLRAANESVGKTATTSETKDGAAAVVTKDVTTYTWVGETSAEAPGAWAETKNWDAGDYSGDCFGYPNGADATVVFKAGTTNAVVLDAVRTIKAIDLSAADVNVTFVGKDGLATNETQLVVSTSASKINGKGLTLKLDRAALSLTTETSEDAASSALGENGTIELANGANLYVTVNLYNTAKGGRILLSGDSVFYCYRYYFGNEDNQTVIDDSLLIGERTFSFLNAGGKVLFKGSHPQMFANVSPGNFFGAENASATLEFEVPAEGYDIPPVRCVEGNVKEFGNAAHGTYTYNGATLYVNVAANSPAKQRGRKASTRLVYWSSGIRKDVLKEGTLPSKNDLFIWKDKNGDSTDADLPVSLDVQFTNGPGLMLIIR